MPGSDLFYNIAAMNALFASLAWCAARPNRASILALTLFACIWPFVNGQMEGHILLVLNSHDAITVSDTFSLVAIVVAAVQGIRLTRAARSRAHADALPRTDLPAQQDLVQRDM